MIVYITRFVLVTAGAMSGFAASRLIDWSEATGFPQYLVILIFIILGWSIGYVLGGILGRELTTAFSRAEEHIGELAPTDLLLGAVGLLVGLLVAWLGSLPLRLIEPASVAIIATVALFLMCGYFGMRVALVKRSDVAAAFPQLGGGAKAPGAGGSFKLLDTSAIIDGRFAELRKLGALEGDVRVPRFVLAELQTLADSADDMRRARGRRGLDLLARLQSSEEQMVTVFEADYPDVPDTDGKLLRLASDTDGAIVTVDFNLTNVARVRGVAAFNVNEVADVMRPVFLPGDSVRLQVVRQGKEAGQGVGYLEDGTMVVIQGGADAVGSYAEVEVTSLLQTAAGRMIFAKPIDSAASADPPESEAGGS